MAIEQGGGEERCSAPLELVWQLLMHRPRDNEADLGVQGDAS